ncbi:hypothetical protein [Latilactobacillus phage TMW 1.1365 P3]|nr:hypothetical protein [Latilactobacillus phage TMW 1.1365 P3]
MGLTFVNILATDSNGGLPVAPKGGSACFTVKLLGMVRSAIIHGNNVLTPRFQQLELKSINLTKFD